MNNDCLPFLRVHLQQTTDKGLGIRTNVVPFGAWKVVFSHSNGFKDFIVRVTVKGWVSAEQNVGNDTNGPNVAALGVFSPQDFRCHIVRCSDLGFHNVGGGVVPGQSKVDNLDGGVIGLGQVQKVFGFQVAVDNALDVVAVGNRVKDIVDQFGGVVLRKVALGRMRLGNDAVKQFPAGAQLGNEMQVLLILKDIHQLDNVRVIDLLQNLNLSLENLNLANFGLANRLDGVPLLRLTMHTLSNHSVMPVTKFLGINVIAVNDNDKIGKGRLACQSVWMA